MLQDTTLDQFCILLELFERNKISKDELVLQLPAAISATWDLDHELTEVSIDGLLDNGLSQHFRTRIAMALIRGLIVTRATDELEPTLRGRINSFFDNVLDSSVYRAAGIHSGDPNFEKSNKLAGLFQKTFEELDELASSIVSLPRNEMEFNLLRQRILSVLNKNTTRMVMAPFWRGVQDFEKTLGTIGEYVNNRESLSIDAYETATRECERHLNQVAQTGSIDSMNHQGHIITVLLGLVKDDMNNRPIAQAPNIAISKPPKRYPLHRINHEFLVNVIVSNSGPGVARNVIVSIDTNASLTVLRTEESIGDLKASDSTNLSFPLRVNSLVENDELMIVAEWINFDGSEGMTEDTISIHGQNPDMNWQLLESQNPYALDPISDSNSLFGRDTDIRKLQAFVAGSRVNSCWVTGQRRVGKTSLVQTFMTSLAETPKEEIVCLYLSTGEIQTQDAPSTIDNLVRGIVSGLKRYLPRLEHVQEPIPNGAFSALSEHIDTVSNLYPGIKIVVIIDEFDEFQLPLFQRGDGDSFFNAIRAISQKRYFGFVFVGGEKIRIIQDQQGSRLNHFDTIELDYFSKETQWDDFKSLVQSPAPELEYEDSALNAIHALTEGNPYFVNRLCAVIFGNAVSSRDASITDLEVSNAAHTFVTETAQSTAFQHFWDDGILGTGGETDSLVRTRKIILWSLIDCWKTSSSDDDSVSIALRKFSEWTDATNGMAELRNYVRRRVLRERESGYECRVKLFEDWLIYKGNSDILMDFPDPEAVRIVLEQNKEYEVNAEEIIGLVEKWGPYQGQQITSTDVVAWLRQFGSVRDQRLMFKLLQNIRFYTQWQIQQKLTEAHQSVTLSGLVTIVPGRSNTSRSDILVSHLGSLGQSGIEFARLYAQSNRINRKDNVISGVPTLLGQKLEKNSKVQAVVFVDDFVGTGGSLMHWVSELNGPNYRTLRDKNLKTVIIVITGFVDSLDSIEEGLVSINENNRLYIIDQLDDTDRAFSSTSPIWDTDAERVEAKGIAISCGERLEAKIPLGFGDSEALVVFPNNCPNNSLPILWKKTEKWRPLFERKMG